MSSNPASEKGLSSPSVDSKPSAIGRSNSKRTLKKKGSAANLHEEGSSSAASTAPSIAPTPSLNIDVSEVRQNESPTSSRAAAMTIGSPNGISLAIQSGRRQKGSKTSRHSGPSEEEDTSHSARSLDSSSPRLKGQGEWGISPRSSPLMAAAIAADPNLAYIPTRVYIVSDASFISYQSMALQGANPTNVKALEFTAISIGRMWNLNTFLLIAGEKLSMAGHALFIKSRLARIVSIHDLREDDELILCSNVEGPFALLDRKEGQAPMRLSPRQRLNSAPVEAGGSVSGGVGAGASSTTSSATGPTLALKSESAPRTRPFSSSVSSATPPTLSAPDSPLKTSNKFSSTPPPTSALPPVPNMAAMASVAAAAAAAANAASSSGTSGVDSPRTNSSERKKARGPVAQAVAVFDDASSSGSQSPSKPSRKNLAGGSTPSKGVPGTSTTPISVGSSAGSNDSNTSDRNNTPTPTKSRNGKPKNRIAKRSISSDFTDRSSSKSDKTTSDVFAPEPPIPESARIYSMPISGQMVFEGRQLIRRDSASFLDTIKNEEIKQTALAAIKEHDRSIGITPDHPAVIRFGDTGTEHKTYSVEALYLELKRSRSVPDVWMSGAIRRSGGAWSAITTNVFTRDGSTTSNTSTFRDDEGEFSDDDSSSLTSSSNVDGDLKGDDDKDFNPLTVSEEELMRRMREEEKQDADNLHVMDDQVQAGTLRALIRRLFTHYQNDDFLDHFLLTYDLFIPHLTLLKTLIVLFRVPLTEASKPAATGGNTPLMSSRRNLKLGALRKADSEVITPVASPTTPRGGSSGSKDSPSKETPRSSSDLSESDGRDSPRGGTGGSSDSIANLTSASSPNLGASAASAGMKVVIQHRILNMIKLWIDWRYESLALKANRRFFVLFNEFCEYLSTSSIDKHKVYASTLLSAVKNAKWTRLSLKRQLEVSKAPRLKASISTAPAATIKLTDISVRDWAIYFTLRDQSIYGKIRLKEYHFINFNSKDKSKRAPHLTKLIDHFNKVSFWIATAIFRCEGFGEPTAKSRAAIVSHFLKIMGELKAMKNFSSMMEIYSALSMTAISRLEKTWAYVTSAEQNILKEVTRFTDNNFKAYREAVDVAEPPCIPIQLVLLKDLTFIEENPTVLDNGWINFTKILMLGKAFKTLKRFQTTPYDFKYPSGVYQFHKLHGNLSEDDLFDMSKLVEPSASDLERIARAESEKREAEKKEKKFRELIGKFSRKAATKADLASLTSEMTLDALVTQPDLCAAFYVHLEQHCESSSLDYYRVWATEWKAQSTKNPEKQRELCNRIYDTYLAATSDSAISLNNQSARQAVYKAAKGSGTAITMDLFEAINTEVKARLMPHLADYKRLVEKQ